MFIARGMHQITKAPERRQVSAWRTVGHPIHRARKPRPYDESRAPDLGVAAG